MSERLCYVYLIASVKGGRPSSPVKIGISSAPFARMRELQTGSAFPLVMMGMLAAPSRIAARDAEQWIHFCHPDKAMAGEWFDMDPFQAVETLGFFVSERFAEKNGRGELHLLTTDGPMQ